MSDYGPPIDDIMFVLDKIVGIDAISSWPGYEQAQPDTVRAVLDEAARFVTEVVAPLDEPGDRTGAIRRDDGTVVLPEGFRDAYQRYVAAGWNAVRADPASGGHGFPAVVGLAVQEMLTTACMAFSLCPMLTQSAVELLEAHGTPEMRDVYLPRLVSGEWAGTMVLTEPQAGSDLGGITTRAEPSDDGSWRLYGTKIFITWGEHDLADNIIHFVIARTPGAPTGTRGISLFLVPKFLPDDSGAPEARNDVSCVSIEHKIGIHASPTCVMSFGDRDGAVGYLVGEVNGGLRAMFTMMNDARLAVGLQGLAVTERALQASSTYASERRQGRDPSGSSARIAEHPDVKRMLATIQVNASAMRSMLYDAAGRLDAADRHPDAATRDAAGATARLLTPVVKAWCTDRGVEMASLAIQIHGGVGYIEETGVGRIWRDARIAPIYEGTNGIQAVDLVMRALPESEGAAAYAYLDEIDAVVSAAEGAGPTLGGVGRGLAAAATTLREATEWLLGDRTVADRLAGATPYLELFGSVAAARYLAAAALAEKEEGAQSRRIAEASFYVEQILPRARALSHAVVAGAGSLDFVAGPGTLWV